MHMKSFLALLALTTALSLPSAAMARPVTLKATLKDYGGNGAYLAVYVTDKSDAFVGSVWMAGGKARYYEHLSDWYRATGGDTAQIDGITGASVGSGRTLEVSFDLADSFIDAGYTLHIDAAVEDMRDSPSDIAVPITSDGANKPVRGRRYISSFSYGM
jgi:hypothetical protein